jgi:hypothetical protein
MLDKVDFSVSNIPLPKSLDPPKIPVIVLSTFEIKVFEVVYFSTLPNF